MIVKITQPTFTVNVPSTMKDIVMRPMVVRDDKLLLIAKEDTNPGPAILQAIKQVITNCMAMQLPVDIDELTIFDLEWIFIKLRAQSVSNVVKASFTDKEDDKTYDFQINLDDVKMKYPENPPPTTIKASPMVELHLRYPRASLYGDNEFLNSTEKSVMDVFIKSVIGSIVSPTGSETLKDATPDEVQEFLDSLPIPTREAIIKFLTEQPTVYYEIKYTNSKGTDRTIEFRTLNDFFQFA